MISAKTFFARMNEGRNSWMTDAQLLKGAEEFFKSNGYDKIEYNKVFSEGLATFSSPIVGHKVVDGEEQESIVSFLHSRIEKYDTHTFGSLESLLFEILDNYSSTNLMLVTDSLSFATIIKTEELSVTIENLMDEGMYLLFLNDRFAHALFDEFKKLSEPIPVSD